MPRHFLAFLIQYKYQVIFPIAIAEGPIVTLVCGFLLSLGYLSLLPTLIIVFLGDIISDSVFFTIGRYGRKAVEHIKFLHISEERLQKLEKHFEEHPKKTIAVTKMSYGVASIFLMAAGASRMAYKKFMSYIAPANIIKSSALLAIGYYFGKSYRYFGTYLQYYALMLVIFLPLIYYAFRKRDQIKAFLAFEW